MGGHRTAQEIQVVGAKLDETMKITFHVMKPMGSRYAPTIHIQVPDCEHKCYLVHDQVTLYDQSSTTEKSTRTFKGITDDGSIGIANIGERSLVKRDIVAIGQYNSICYKNFRICSEYEAKSCRPLNPDYYYEWSSETGGAFTNIPLKTKDLVQQPKDHAKICAAFAGS